MIKTDASMLHPLNIDGKEILLIGTAHVSKESVDLVTSTIKKNNPETVCVELCESRYQTITQKQKWQEMDVIKVIKEKKTFLLLSNLLLASFQKRVASNFDITPGQEMLKAMETADEVGAAIHLADRDVHITLSRTWGALGLWDKIKLIFQFLFSLGQINDITKEDIEKMKKEDVLETLLSEIGRIQPIIKTILIDERDMYLASRIKSAPGKKIVAVVGAGHIPGIKKYINTDPDIKELETLPPKRKMSSIIKWGFPLIICALFVIGFFYGETNAGIHMIKWWIIANGVLAGLGAALALAHPLTILSSVLAAPLTSLNPMIAAGWVSGLVEAIIRKPKVMDIENLSGDILSIRGFWKNRLTRILLIVIFTNIGSGIGTFVAIPLMIKML